MSQIDTQIAHAGRHPDTHYGLVNPPVCRASTILFPDLASYEARKQQGDKALRYGRHGTPTTFALEEAITALEGGHQSIALPNGLAAIVVALLALAKPGSHVLLPDTIYRPARSFCERRLATWGVEVTYYDPLIGADIAALLRENTALVYCESPGSLTFEVQDIPAISTAAHARDIPVVMDNTWASPLFFPAMARGVDIVIHALTKYVGGHSDVMLGSITCTARYWPHIRASADEYGFSTSPDDCYLALRGLRTLAVRLRHQMESALTVARWLEARPEVARVIHPGLPSHPQHALWARDFKGAGALFAVELQPCSDAALHNLVDGLQWFGIGSSWGGYESLVNVVHTSGARSLSQPVSVGPVLRLFVGLEGTDDLIRDLTDGLSRLSLTPADSLP